MCCRELYWNSALILHWYAYIDPWMCCNTYLAMKKYYCSKSDAVVAILNGSFRKWTSFISPHHWKSEHSSTTVTRCTYVIVSVVLACLNTFETYTEELQTHSEIVVTSGKVLTRMFFNFGYESLMMLTDKAMHAALEVVVSLPIQSHVPSHDQLLTGCTRIGKYKKLHIARFQPIQQDGKHTCHLLKGTFKITLVESGHSAIQVFIATTDWWQILSEQIRGHP